MAERNSPALTFSASSSLGKRDCQMIEGLMLGKLNKEIAFELGLGVGTIKAYMHRVYRKIGVTNRTQCAVWGTINHEALRQ